MRILHLCLGSFFVDNYSYQENILTKYHARMGHDVTVITSLFTFGEDGQGTFLGHPMEYDNSDGVHVIRLESRKPRIFFSTLRRFQGLFETVCRVEPDIIFSHNLSYADTTEIRKYIKSHPSVKLFADNHADYVNSARNWLS